MSLGLSLLGETKIGKRRSRRRRKREKMIVLIVGTHWMDKSKHAKS
jgi:hypothetical protein